MDGVKEMHENLNLASNGSQLTVKHGLQIKTSTPISNIIRRQEIDEIDLQIAIGG